MITLETAPQQRYYAPRGRGVQGLGDFGTDILGHIEKVTGSLFDVFTGAGVKREAAAAQLQAAKIEAERNAILEAERSERMPYLIGGGVVAVALLAGTFIILQTNKPPKKALAGYSSKNRRRRRSR
jgi:hypothetical protein